MHHAQGPGRKVRALFFVSSLVGGGEFTLQRGVGHLHPHIFFSVAPKRKRAVHGPKEKALCGQKFSRTGKFLA